MTYGWGISCKIALRWMPLDLTDDKTIKSTLVQVMAWCRQATSRYLSQCWPRSMLPYGVTRPRVNPAGGEYSWRIRSIPWLLMPWLLTSPGHQQPSIGLWMGPSLPWGRFQLPVPSQCSQMMKNANILIIFVSQKQFHTQRVKISLLMNYIKALFIKPIQHLKG